MRSESQLTVTRRMLTLHEEGMCHQFARGGGRGRGAVALAAERLPLREPDIASREECVVSEEYGRSSRSTVAARYRGHADAFEALIAAVPPHRWDQPSPCEGWTARDVVA